MNIEKIHNQLPTYKDKLINYLLYDVSWIDTGFKKKYKYKSLVNLSFL